MPRQLRHEKAYELPPHGNSASKGAHCPIDQLSRPNSSFQESANENVARSLSTVERRWENWGEEHASTNKSGVLTHAPDTSCRPLPINALSPKTGSWPHPGDPLLSTASSNASATGHCLQSVGGVPKSRRHCRSPSHVT